MGYTASYDADVVARVIGEWASCPGRRASWAGLSVIYHGFCGTARGSACPACRLAMPRGFMDELKAVKSAYDIGQIRRAARMQDEIFAKVVAHERAPACTTTT